MRQGSRLVSWDAVYQTAEGGHTGEATGWPSPYWSPSSPPPPSALLLCASGLGPDIYFWRQLNDSGPRPQLIKTQIPRSLFIGKSRKVFKSTRVSASLTRNSCERRNQVGPPVETEEEVALLPLWLKLVTRHDKEDTIRFCFPIQNQILMNGTGLKILFLVPSWRNKTRTILFFSEHVHS